MTQSEFSGSASMFNSAFSALVATVLGCCTASAQQWEWSGAGESITTDPIYEEHSNDYYYSVAQADASSSAWGSGLTFTWGGYASASARTSSDTSWSGYYGSGDSLIAEASTYGEYAFNFGPLLEDDEEYEGPLQAVITIQANFSGSTRASAWWGESWWIYGGTAPITNVWTGASASASFYPEPGPGGGVGVQGGSTNMMVSGTPMYSGTVAATINELEAGNYSGEFGDDYYQNGGFTTDVSFEIVYEDEYTFATPLGTFNTYPSLQASAAANFLMMTDESDWESAQANASASASVSGSVSYTIH